MNLGSIILIVVILGIIRFVAYPILQALSTGSDFRETNKFSSGIMQKLSYWQGKKKYYKAMGRISEQFPLQINERDSAGVSWSGKYRERSLCFRLDNAYLHETGFLNLKMIINVPELKGVVVRMFSREYLSKFVPSFSLGSLASTSDNKFDEIVMIPSSFLVSALARLNRQARLNIIVLMLNYQLLSFDISAGEVSVAWYGTHQFFPNLVKNSLDLVLDTIALFVREGSAKDLLIENYMAAENISAKLQIMKALNYIRAGLDRNDRIFIDAQKSGNSELYFEAVKLLGKDGYSKLKPMYFEANMKMKLEIIRYMMLYNIREMIPYFLKNADNLEERKDKQFELNLIKLFAATRTKEAEPILLDIVKDRFHRDTAIIDEALHALTDCGGYDSIEALYNLKNETNSRQIERAIATIRQRIGEGDSGWLSVQSADEDVGNLSLSDKIKNQSKRAGKGEKQ